MQGSNFRLTADFLLFSFSKYGIVFLDRFLDPPMNSQSNLVVQTNCIRISELFVVPAEVFPRGEVMPQTI